jgi:hypothetical protein
MAEDRPPGPPRRNRARLPQDAQAPACERLDQPRDPRTGERRAPVRPRSHRNIRRVGSPAAPRLGFSARAAAHDSNSLCAMPFGVLIHVAAISSFRLAGAQAGKRRALSSQADAV